MEKKFEKDFKELQELNLKNKDLIESLNKEFEVKCNSFLDEYNIKSIVKPTIGIDNFLNKDLSYIKLSELLKQKIGILGYFNSLRNHMNKTKIEPKFLDYNLSYIQDLESKFQSLDSIENANSYNDLFTNNGYMIDNELENFLKLANNKGFIHGNNEYVYIVIFNKVKIKDKDVIIFNYIPYNKVFFKLLYIYILLEQYFSITIDSIYSMNKDLFFVVDSSLAKECNDIRYTYNYDENIISKNENFNFIHLVKLDLKGKLVDLNFDNMGELIRSLNHQDKVSIINKLNSEITPFIDYEEGYLFNYISKFLFLVSDLDTFIKSIRDNIDININQGPQKYRGSINYISHTLISFDKGFRDSLYNHNRKFIGESGEHRHDRYIPKSCFSFKNIHINMGKIR